MKYWAGLLEESSYRKEKNFGFRGVYVCNVKFNGATFYQDYKWLSVKLYQFTKKKKISKIKISYEVCVCELLKKHTCKVLEAHAHDRGG